MATFSDLIQMINTELGQASGPDVQLYGEPRIAQMLQREYNNAFDKRFWKNYSRIGTFTLDGVNGAVTTDISALIKRFKDIQHIWLANGTRNPLPEMPMDVQPTQVTQPCVTEAALATTSGFFRIYPKTTVGDVIIRYRTQPVPFVDTAEVDFDNDYLLFRCVANFLVMEGTNLKAAEYYAKNAAQTWQDLLNQEQNLSKSLYSTTISNVDNWNTR